MSATRTGNRLKKERIMPTDNALLARLQAHWQAAAVSPATTSTTTRPIVAEPPPPSVDFRGLPSTSVDCRGGLRAFLGDDDQADDGRRWCDFEPDDDRLQSQADDDQDYLPFDADAGKAPLPDFLELMDDDDRAEYLGPHRRPEPCPWCGGRQVHNPLCVALCDDWALLMPFGKHKGRAVRDLDPDYLVWLVRSGAELGDELRREIERVLQNEIGQKP